MQELYNLRWQDGVDIILVAILIYQLILLLRGTQGIQVLAGMVILFLAYWGARRLNLFTLEWVLESFVKSFLLIVIILFQADIRRVLSRMGRRAIIRPSIPVPKALEEICAAADSLASKKIGGLIVLERQAQLNDYLEGAIRLDALVTRELLTSLFWPHTPTHDGAVIVQGDLIIAAGCVLPLSRRPGIDKTMGTRHRAGLGITENTDAVALIISEERGQVSLAQGGKMIPNLSRVQLLQTLEEIFIREKESEQESWLAKIFNFTEQK
ncbi:MAG: TIGR00159 family protein [Deltaproteobacteria bacterium]|nr:TIGR00159 family protein [Deltaproteobacteria bacterium]MBW1951475.1 TIGR00159 family protein [Deltaproteobacteria bacterium]MBW1986904.1 TIGR00159 family protein [Deltaproteobacteria bacterium]MBW2135014.1 TIGR00159 family protein [Deltaproteobacteria bacterium]